MPEKARESYWSAALSNATFTLQKTLRLACARPYVREKGGTQGRSNSVINAPTTQKLKAGPTTGVGAVRPGRAEGKRPEKTRPDACRPRQDQKIADGRGRPRLEDVGVG